MNSPFTLPVHVESTPSGFVVTDSKGKHIAYVYGRDDLARLCDSGGGYMTMEDARAVADAIVKSMNGEV